MENRFVVCMHKLSICYYFAKYVFTPRFFTVYAQGRIKGGQRGQLTGAPLSKRAPVMKFICFKQNTRLKNFVIQKRYKKTTLYHIPMLR